MIRPSRGFEIRLICPSRLGVYRPPPPLPDSYLSSVIFTAAS